MTCFILLSPNLIAQEADTLKPFEDPPLEIPVKTPFYKSKTFKATIAPAVFIGYGISTIKDNGIYSSYDAQSDIIAKYPNFDSWIDDVILIAPYVELAVVNLLKVPSNSDFLNTSLLILKAETIFGVSILALKNITNQERPNGEDFYSMPSGHTAQAFLAANIVNAELRHKGPWYGIGAYSMPRLLGP